MFRAALPISTLSPASPVALIAAPPASVRFSTFCALTDRSKLRVVTTVSLPPPPSSTIWSSLFWIT